jgi:hypothetical protein
VSSIGTNYLTFVPAGDTNQILFLLDVAPRTERSSIHGAHKLQRGEVVSIFSLEFVEDFTLLCVKNVASSSYHIVWLK